MRDSGTENTEMTDHEEHRKAVLSSVLKGLKTVITAAKEPGDEYGVKLYLLGAYTVLNMLGIATDAGYDAFCDEALKL